MKLIKSIILSFVLLLICCTNIDKKFNDHMHNAQLASSRNDFSKAIKYYTKAISIKDTMLAYFERGKVYFLFEHDYKRAGLDFSKAAELCNQNYSNEKLISVYIYLMMSYYMQNDYGSCQNILNKLLVLTNNEKSLIAFQCHLDLLQNKHEEAIINFKEIDIYNIIFPSYDEIINPYSSIGYIFWEFLNSSSFWNDNEALSHTLIVHQAISLIETERYNESIKLVSSHKLNYTYPVEYLLLAVSYYLNNNETKAKQCISEALKLDENILNINDKYKLLSSSPKTIESVAKIKSICVNRNEKN